MRRLLFASFVLCLSSITNAQQPKEILPPTAMEIMRFRIHDVDTVSGDIVLPFKTARLNESVRDSTFDGWEVTRTRKTDEFEHFTPLQWDAEIAKGEIARDALRDLAKNGAMYVEWVRGEEQSVYNRLAGPLWVRTSSGRIVNVKRWAEANGFVRK